MKEIDNDLILSYEPMINSIARKYTYNRWDYEDCKQEIFIKMLECFEKYDFSKNIPLEAFIRVCAVRRALSFAKKNNRQNSKELVILEDMNCEDLEPTSEEVDEIYNQFLKMYSKHENGAIIKKKYIDGFSSKELAKEYNISTRAIDKKIKKFNEWFRKEFE